MSWFFFAFLTAFFESLKDVATKKSVRHVSAYVTAWAWASFSLFLLVPLLLLDGIPTPGEQFWLALLSAGVIDTLAFILYVSAIQHSDLSLTVPMIAFTPLLLLVTSPLIIGEYPSLWGIIGIVLVVVGSYVLNIKAGQQGFLAPYKALFRERGPRMMLGVAGLWSIAANIDKIGVLNSSPIFWIASINVFIALALLPFVLRQRDSFQQMRSNFPALLLLGTLAALVTICQMTAITMTLVPYVIAVKRTSTVMSVLFGTLLLREQGLRERLAGVLLMLAGVVCIAVL